MENTAIANKKMIHSSGKLDNLYLPQIIYKFIELYGVTSFSRDNWLTPKENQFLTLCVIYCTEGGDLNDTDVNKFLTEKMEFSNDKAVYTYRNKLINKGWLIKEKRNVYLINPLKIEKDIQGLKFSISLIRYNAARQG